MLGDLTDDDGVTKSNFSVASRVVDREVVVVGDLEIGGWTVAGDVVDGLSFSFIICCCRILMAVRMYSSDTPAIAASSATV